MMCKNGKFECYWNKCDKYSILTKIKLSPCPNSFKNFKSCSTWMQKKYVLCLTLSYFSLKIATTTVVHVERNHRLFRSLCNYLLVYIAIQYDVSVCEIRQIVYKKGTKLDESTIFISRDFTAKIHGVQWVLTNLGIEF